VPTGASPDSPRNPKHLFVADRADVRNEPQAVPAPSCLQRKDEISQQYQTYESGVQFEVAMMARSRLSADCYSVEMAHSRRE
jgi:hypothetical protein